MLACAVYRTKLGCLRYTPRWAYCFTEESRKMVQTGAHASNPEAKLLWEKIQETYEKAVASGAAKGIPTTEAIEAEGSLGVEMVVRIAEVLENKPSKPEQTESGEAVNPFLPYDEELWVQHLSDSHTLLLNKFNLVDHHTIVVTREFQSQDEPLAMADLAATKAVIDAMPYGGLAYFNHGPDSGKSQPHKHVQVVPLPLSRAVDAPVPLQDVLDETLQGEPLGMACEMLKLPYRAYACRIEPGFGAEELEVAYLELMSAAGVQHDPGQALKPSYGWLMTRHWMMLVPRSRAAYQGINANAISYAGTLFLKRPEMQYTVHNEGPLQILAKMAYPW
eukprot:jgi/Ulvmu1/3847/UM018_0063.1